MAFRLSARARGDLNDILAYSLEHYGRDAAERYALLVAAAIDLVSEDPELIGSRAVVRRPGLRVYPIAHSRYRLPLGSRVRRPVHQIVYSVAEDGVVDILALVGTNYPAANIIG